MYGIVIINEPYVSTDAFFDFAYSAVFSTATTTDECTQ